MEVASALAPKADTAALLLSSAIPAAFRERKHCRFAVRFPVSEAAVTVDHARRHSNLILDLERGRAALAELDDARGAQTMEGGSCEFGDSFTSLEEMLVKKLLGIDLAMVLANVGPGCPIPGCHLDGKRLFDRTPDVADLLAGLCLTDAKAAVVDKGFAELDHIRGTLAGIAG